LQRHDCRFRGKERAFARLRHTQVQGTIRQARSRCCARMGRPRGVDCFCCAAGRSPARRALLLSSCYFGKTTDRGFAGLTPSVESVGRFRFGYGAANSSPVILVFNRGKYSTRICGHRGKPWIFPKTRLVCGAAESSCMDFCRSECSVDNRADNRPHNRPNNRTDNRRDNRYRGPCSAASSL